MYETTIERLTEAGLPMYEISNFARPGEESRHNLVYWANDAYFGFGVARRDISAAFDRPTPATWPPICGGWRPGESATGPHEELSPEERARDRHADAAANARPASSATTFKLRTGFDLDRLSGSVIERFRRRVTWKTMGGG